MARLDGERVFSGGVKVRDDASVEAFLAAEQALGAVTVAVANASIFPNYPVLDMPVAEWDRVMDTNLREMFLT